jgi:hypothetical protein
MQSLALAAEELFSVDILLQVTCVVKAARDPRFPAVAGFWARIEP